MMEYRGSVAGVEDKHLHFLRILESKVPIYEKPKKRRSKK